MRKRPASESGRYIGKGLGGRSMLRGYNGKMRPSAWAR